jgi:uncharacterized protein
MNDNLSQTESSGALPIELFASPEEIHAIGSPMRKRILSLLAHREMSFEEIVAHTGKAKSTISVHLKGLIEDGLIRSRPAPEDARRKIFFIDSKHLGTLSSATRVQEDLSRYMLSSLSLSGDASRFFKLMFRAVRLTLLSEGINIDPILHTAGTNVGKAIFEGLKDPDLERLLQNLATFWEQHNLGRLQVVGLDPITIDIYDCFECQDLPKLGRPACAFDSGILTSIFSEYLHEPQTVREIKCYAMADDCCRFVIKRTV